MDVCVIGGGASGLIAAIEAAKSGLDVTILEKMNRVGKKILVTGNGRCNLTNLAMDVSCFRGESEEFIAQALHQFDEKSAMAYFESMGLMLHDRNGYVYPLSDQAGQVVDVLETETRKYGVRMITDCEVEKVTAGSEGYEVQSSQGVFHSPVIILACGGKAASKQGSDGSGYRLAKQLGHHIRKPLPALTALHSDRKFFKQLHGARLQAKVSVYADGKLLDTETGEVQLTNYGLSGIPIFQLSRYAAVALDEKKEVCVVLSLLPEIATEQLEEFLRIHHDCLSGRKKEQILCGLCNDKVARVLLREAGIDGAAPADSFSETEWGRLTELIKHWEIPISGIHDFEQAQVTCGGVHTAQIHPETMESLIAPRCYIVGELLDVDGTCGGYNLQWAWTSGYLAGQHCKKRIETK
ncbi:MAG: NAD(P)/FAD-dependent oxidoreductase [Lachnospiraceae bacterium]